MIQRSGLSARSRSPISAATSRTRSTTFLSSVSGIVKNCGAWGSIAPPTMVEFMDFSLAGESIAQSAGQQAEEPLGVQIVVLHRRRRRRYARPQFRYQRSRHLNPAKQYQQNT